VSIGLTTWLDVAAIDGNVLLIVNSAPGDESEAGRVFDALDGCVQPSRLYVIATPEWLGWLGRRGWSGDRVLLALDAVGDALELNYFLESAEALRWIVARRFAAVIGSAPHNLYNEEVKDIFERRVGIMLGPARFLLHTLPNPYVFSLSLPDLLQRFNRGRKAAEYGAVSRALIDDLHRAWAESGKPSVCDARSFDDAVGALERHLGANVLSWDEASPIPLDPPDSAGTAADFLLLAEAALHQAADIPSENVMGVVKRRVRRWIAKRRQR